MIIDFLRQEHRNIEKLLLVLEQELSLFARGERPDYEVIPLGEKAAWVQNVRAENGKAVLQHGRREEVRLEEIPADQRAPVLKAYLQRAPGARPHVPVDKDAGLSEFERIADQIPVFRVLAVP